MGRTRTQLRQLTARETRLSVFRTGTADSGGTTSTLVDAPLGNVPNDTFNGAYLYLTSGSPTHSDLQITDFVAATGTCTFRPALGAAPDSLSFEILPFSAEQFHNTISDVLTELAAEEILQRTFQSFGLVGGSPAYNADFAYWTGANAPAGYSVDSGTPTKQTTITRISDQNMQLASGTVSVGNPWRRFFLDFAGDTTRFGCWVYATGASQARINLSVDGTDNYSSYHSGDSGWELLTVEVTLDTDIESVIPKFVTSGTSYFSDWFVYSPSKPVPLPWTLELYPNGPEELQVAWQEEWTASPVEGRQVRYKREIPCDFRYSADQGPSLDRVTAWLTVPHNVVGRRLMATTQSPLTLPTANTDVVEVNPQEATLVAKRAAIKLLESLQAYAPAELAKQSKERVAQLQRDIAASITFLKNNRGVAELHPW